MLTQGFSLEDIVARLIALILGMTIHEFAHCFVADQMGDDTPRRMGRLTLNPFVHIHLIGFLMFLLVGFGILGSAPINPYRMRNPRWGSLAATAAGPLSNLLLAIIVAIPLRFLVKPQDFYLMYAEGGLKWLPLLTAVTIITINVILFVFNLIPLFPLDGWRMMLSLLPPDLAYWWEKHKVTSQYIFFGLILLSFLPLRGVPNILGILIGQPSAAIYNFLLGF